MFFKWNFARIPLEKRWLANKKAWYKNYFNTFLIVIIRNTFTWFLMKHYWSGRAFRLSTNKRTMWRWSREWKRQSKWWSCWNTMRNVNGTSWIAEYLMNNMWSIIGFLLRCHSKRSFRCQNCSQRTSVTQNELFISCFTWMMTFVSVLKSVSYKLKKYEENIPHQLNFEHLVEIPIPNPWKWRKTSWFQTQNYLQYQHPYQRICCETFKWNLKLM